jgi:hypothetical protein
MELASAVCCIATQQTARRAHLQNLKCAYFKAHSSAIKEFAIKRRPPPDKFRIMIFLVVSDPGF